MRCLSNLSRWWFQTFFIFTPTWGNDPIWLIFSNGLKPPTGYPLQVLWMLHNFGSVLLSYLSSCRNANDHRNSACMADNNSLRTIYPIAHAEDLDHWEMSSCGYPCRCASRVSHSWRLTKAFLGFSNSRENWNISPTPPPSSCQELFWHHLFFFGVWLCFEVMKRSPENMRRRATAPVMSHHFLCWLRLSDECDITFVFHRSLAVGESTRLLYFHARLGFSAWNHSQWTEVSCLKVCGKDGDIEIEIATISMDLSFDPWHPRLAKNTQRPQNVDGCRQFLAVWNMDELLQRQDHFKYIVGIDS